MVLDHLRLPRLSSPGTIGVTVFFVLSGWLITRLLLAEHDAVGRIDLRAFWGRRARRLLPALVVFLAVMSVAGLLTRDPLVARPATVLGALLFVNNWPAATGINLGGLHHTWSLAVEEQFYLAWPLLMAAGLAAARGRRRVVVVAAVLLALSLSQTVHLALDDAAPRRIYAGTDTRASALLAGCLLALLGVERVAARWRRPLVVVTALAALACVASAFVDRYSVVALVAAPWIAVTATLGAILARPRRRSVVLEYVGRRSYALYLWHHPLLVLVLPRVHGSAHWPVAAALVAASFVLAELSWRLVEAPFLQGRGRPGNARTPDQEVGGPSGRRGIPAGA